MILKPGITIKRDNENETLFILDNNSIHWVRNGPDEFFCSIPEGWTCEVVALIMRRYKDHWAETIGIMCGKTGTDFCPLLPPANKTINIKNAESRIIEGKIIYNGAIYKLVE